MAEEGGCVWCCVCWVVVGLLPACFLLSTCLYYLRLALRRDVLRGKVVWVTGASSGIGKELSRQLARRGAKLILSSRREAELQRVKDECVKAATEARHPHAADNVRVLPLDMEDFDALETNAKAATGFWGGVDVLVNNAGVSTRSLAKDTTLSVDRKVMNTNYFGAVALTKHLLPSMLTARSGLIVVVSSVAGLMEIGMRTSYCASKFALHGFFESLRLELNDSGIKVLMVCPGPIKTEVAKNALLGDGSRYGKVDPFIENGMPVEDCAAQIVDAMIAGEDHLVIASPAIKLLLLSKRLFPAVFRLVAGKGSQRMIRAIEASKKQN